MSTLGSVRDTVKAAGPGTLFKASDFDSYGPRTAVESALSRLARSSELRRVRRGIYFRPSLSKFGVGGVSGAATALKYAADRAVGPAGATAAAMLGLSTQMPAVPEIAIVGRPPTSIPGVRFRERSNTKRVAMNLRPKEVAILELAREHFAPVEVSFEEVRTRLRGLLAAGEIDSNRIKDAAVGEPRSVRRYMTELFAA